MSVLGFLRRKGLQAGEEAMPDDLREIALKIEDASTRHQAPTQAAEHARLRMHEALRAARTAARQTPFRDRPGPLRAFASKRRVGLAASLALVMLLVTAGGLGIWSVADAPLGSPSAEAIVLQGTLDSQGPDALTVITESGTEVVTLQGDLAVVDAVGNPIGLDALLKGQAISVRGRRDEHSGIVVSEIKAVSEIHGKVTSFDRSRLRLSSSRGEFDIIMTDATKVEGVLRVGAPVEVEILRGEGGTFIALEVEVEDGDEEDEKDDRAQGAGPFPPASVPAPVIAPSRGAGEEGIAAPAPSPEAQRQPVPPPTASQAARRTGSDDDDEVEESGPGTGPTPTPPQTSASGSASGGGYEGDGEEDSDRPCDPDEDDPEGDDEDDAECEGS